MDHNLLLSLAGLALSALGAIALYLASPHQRLTARPVRSAPALIVGAVATAAGLAAWIASWGGLVGGLLGLGVWMLVSTILPYLMARRGS